MELKTIDRMPEKELEVPIPFTTRDAPEPAKVVTVLDFGRQTAAPELSDSVHREATEDDEDPTKYPRNK